MRIIENTYPKHENAAFGEVGESVEWRLKYGQYELTQVGGHKVYFSTAPVDKNGNLRSNGKKPILKGVVAEVKSKRWRLVVGD